MEGISVVINTYNAEKHLERVLDSVDGFDEVVVCDMESTDGTVDIARRRGCRIVTFPKGDCVSAEPARTFAIQSASCRWVLVVDADELVPVALRNYLYKRIKEKDCPQGLWIPRKNYFMGRFMHCNYPDYLLRFFVKEGTTWPPFVHTFPDVKGRTEKIPPAAGDIAFIHLANDTIRTIVDKTNLYTENEVVKKGCKYGNIRSMLWRPAFRFFKSYVLKGGFRDGRAGLVYATIEGFYQFMMVCKMIEKKHRREI